MWHEMKLSNAEFYRAPRAPFNISVLCFFVAILYGHDVKSKPDPMNLPFAGPDGTITLAPDAGEPSPDCQVSATIDPIKGSEPALVKVTPAGDQPAAKPVLIVHALRQPQGDSESVTVTGTRNSAGIPAGTCPKGMTGDIRVKVTVTRTTPVVKAVVDAASFAPSGIVPGSIATLFGDYLTGAVGIAGAPSLPLPTSISDTSVLINGQPVPLIASVEGQEQVNFQVPSTLKPDTSATVAVDNGVNGATVTVPVVAEQPAIFGYNTAGKTYGAILHANYQLASSDQPATAGETVLIYCTGLGVVSSPPDDGLPATGQPTSALPTVTVASVPANVTFSGLAPGFVGLYQVNVEVPAGVPVGDQPVVLEMNGKPSPAILLPIK